MTRGIRILAFAAISFLALAASPHAQSAAGRADTPQGTVERVQVHARSLEANLAGDSPDRDVSVYLPPSYSLDKSRRYPVLYLLHGFTDNDSLWFGRSQHFIDVPATMNRAASFANARELLVVMPNADTRFHGSMYSASVTTGDWETFITKELVSFIDSHYRTLPRPASRGLAGHSMGGYGAIKLAMKYPGVFSVVYALSPCCMLPAPELRKTNAESIHTFEQLDAADFFTKAYVAMAAAWSPNPQAPPLFADNLTSNGVVQPLILAKWSANAPLALVDEHVDALRQLRGIALDAGDKDIAGIADNAATFSEILKTYDIQHFFEVYPGTHVSGIAERFQTKVLPFFWSRLSF